jgi:hypothetical protein
VFRWLYDLSRDGIDIAYKCGKNIITVSGSDGDVGNVQVDVEVIWMKPRAV